MVIIQDCKRDHVVDFLTRMHGGRAGLLFTHGLGDCVLFLPLFEKLVREFPNWDIKLCFIPERNYSFLYENSMVVHAPYGQYGDKFDVMFSIDYLEAPRNERDSINFQRRFPNIKNNWKLVKPYVCNETEIGLPNFVWTPFRIKGSKGSPYSKRIGVHFFGRPTGIIRDAEYDVGKQIWEEIKFCGYEPFEIQMFSPDVPYWSAPDFIGIDTLRKVKADLKVMYDEISKCRYFFGIDSGPLYFASSILGLDRCIALERERKIDKVLPHPITLIDIVNYKQGSVLQTLFQKEKGHG